MASPVEIFCCSAAGAAVAIQASGLSEVPFLFYLLLFFVLCLDWFMVGFIRGWRRQQDQKWRARHSGGCDN